MSRKSRPTPSPADSVAAAIGRQYDTVEYPAHPFASTHPNRLGVLAFLNGMRPQPADRCRVLELGCNEGANLIPMALSYPGSEFVGVDIAHLPITKGNEQLQALGIGNVKLIEADLREIDASYGQFDYIIVHGLYAWVPWEVRDRLIGVCRERLSERGIAYVSYNALPGGHLRRILREMMLFHTRSFDEPMEKAKEAKAFLAWMIAGAKQTAGPGYLAFIVEEAERTRRKREADIFHDDLAAINEPVYFTQFMGHAAQHHLQFLAEAEQFGSDEEAFSGHVGEQLRDLGQQDILLKEQYVDFIDCRFFRKTLLVREELQLTRDFNANAVTPLSVTCETTEAPSDSEPGSITFSAGQTGSATVKDPLMIAAFRRLTAAFPASVPFPELLDGVLAELGGEAPSKFKATVALARFVYRTHRVGIFDLSVRPFALVTVPSERPLASAHARLLAPQRSDLTNLRHEIVVVEDAFARALLPLLDGTRDRAALAAAVAGLEAAGDEDDGKPLAERIEAQLQSLAHDGLLMA